MPETPTSPDFWNHRYDSGQTPWDLGGVPAALTQFLAAHPGHGERALIPGCGCGYELTAFDRAGYDVTAIDFSPAAVSRARQNVGTLLADRVIEGDFFTYPFPERSFTLVYERTFLCALPPLLWRTIVERLAALLAPGGMLIGTYFFGAKDDGPPYGLDADEPQRLFGERFSLVADHPVDSTESLPLFAGRERWQERRLAAAVT